MPITPIDTIQIPAKTLTKLWAGNISILAPQVNGEAFAVVRLTPYNDAGEKDQEVMLHITSIMQKAQANPTSNIAKAMEYILAAIDDEYKAQQ